MAKGIIKKCLVSVAVLVMCLVLVSCQSINRQALASQKINDKILSSEDTDSNSSANNNELSGANGNHEVAKISLENLVSITNENRKSDALNLGSQGNNENATTEVGQAVGSSDSDIADNNNSANNNSVNKDKEDNKNNANGQGDRDNISDESNLCNRIIGIINDLYIDNNKIYITVDSLEFYRGEEAYTEARKDGKLYVDENGKEFLPDGYYIRNNSKELKTYEVSSNTVFKLCIYLVDKNTTQNSAETVGVQYSDFEKYINSTKSFDGRSRMFWINSDNGIVNKLEMQYTP